MKKKKKKKSFEETGNRVINFGSWSDSIEWNCLLLWEIPYDLLSVEKSSVYTKIANCFSDISG